MSPSEPLPRNKRRFIFVTMCVLFIILVPLFVLYAIGYRIDVGNGETAFRAVGGIYINIGDSDLDLYKDEERITDMRLFQRAAYIQSLSAGLHRVHVQGDGVHTWVKNLPVWPHLVTEARSFNMPIVPQIRVVGDYLDLETGAGVVFSDDISPFAGFASTTNLWYATTSTSSITHVANNEHIYVAGLFATSTMNLYEQNRQPRENFTFDRTPLEDLSSKATTTQRIGRNTTLTFRSGEVYASWTGPSRSLPFYYCLQYHGASSTRAFYGDHVYEDLLRQGGDKANSFVLGETVCRNEIRIDRQNKKILWFDLFPDREDLVLMLLSDGLYVVEIDDRAWQNVQQIYLSDQMRVVVDGRQIYIKDGDWFVEIYTEIRTNRR